MIYLYHKKTNTSHKGDVIMKFPNLTLTKAKTISMICWGVLSVIYFFSVFFPILNPQVLPVFIRIIFIIIIIFLAYFDLYLSFSKKIEKPDERSVYNSYKTNSTIFNLFFILIMVVVIYIQFKGINSFTVSKDMLFFVFAFVNFIEKAIFVYYDKFSE